MQNKIIFKYEQEVIEMSICLFIAIPFFEFNNSLLLFIYKKTKFIECKRKDRVVKYMRYEIVCNSKDPQIINYLIDIL